jgi:hypothetical protein
MITIAELHRILEHGLLEGQSSEEPELTEAVRSFNLLLSDYPTLGVAEFCANARVGLNKTAKGKKVEKKQSTPRKSAKSAISEAAKPPAASVVPQAAKPTAALSESVVSRYLGELERTKTDSQQFETVIERMKKDRQVRPIEAVEIANRFMGGTQPFKTKPQVAKAILNRQMTDARAARKAEHIADIF